MTNILLRREALRPEAGRALAMFGGCALVAGATAVAGDPLAAIPAPSLAAPDGGAGRLGCRALHRRQRCLQYGAARLAANATSVIMLSEVLFASRRLALGGGAMTKHMASAAR